MRGYLFGILSAVFWALSGLLYNELPLSEYTARESNFITFFN